MPCRPILNRAALPVTRSLPRAGRAFCLALFAALAALTFCVLAGAQLQAQTAHYDGAVVTLGSGFSDPAGVAVDANGNVYVADNGNSAVKEILAVNGRIPASPVINTLGSGFAHPYGVAVDGSGNVFVTDQGEVKEIEAVNGSIPASPTIRILASGLNSLYGLAVDGRGDVFVSGYNSAKEIVAVNGSIPASPKILSLGVTNDFRGIFGVAVDGSGNVFVGNSTGDPGGNYVGEIPAAGGYTTDFIVKTFYWPEGVAVDKSGNVFVADIANNAVNEIVAVNGSIPASPTVLTLGSGFSNPDDVAVDGSGNIYVADSGNNAVKEIETASANFGQVNLGTTSLSPITLSFTFDTASTLGSSGVAVVTQGNTGMDFYNTGGGTCNANFYYNAGGSCMVTVNFAPLAPGLRYGAVELLDENGVLLATSRLQGIGVGPQATFANTTLGVSNPALAGTLGSGLSGPGGVAVDAKENVFVADSNDDAVKEMVAAGGYSTVNTLSSGINSTYFQFPNGVALDGGGNVWVANTFGDGVVESVAAGGYTTANRFWGWFSNPYGVAVDGLGNVFVADFGNDAVKEIVAVSGSIPASPTVRTLAGGLNGPDGVAVDGSGNVFFASYGDGTVEEIEAVNGSIPASPTIKTIRSGLSGPSNLSVDGIGNLFVTDTGNNEVKEIVAAGGYTTVKILGSGFSFPEAVAADGYGNVIVADTGNNAVKLLDYVDPPLLVFGPAPVGSTSINSPYTVTVTNDGNAPLIFPLPTTGANPSVPANFAWDPASTCIQTTPGSSQAFQLAAGASCTMALDFKPTTVGAVSGNVVLTDNNLNIAGASQTIQMTGTGSAVKAVLTTPTPGSTLTGTSATFSWIAGGGVTTYEFRLGTTGPGSKDVYNPTGSVTSALTTGLVSNIPANGQTLYARLYSWINGAWQYTDYTYKESGTPVKAVLTSPTPGATLGASATFNWTAGSGVTTYELRVGTTGAGSKDVYNSSESVTSALTTGAVSIPAFGVTLYARLYSWINGAWQYNDYTYTESGTPVPALLTSPAPGSTLSGASATFSWTAGGGNTKYEFRLGTTGAGSKDVYNSTQATTTALSTPLITGIPAYGVTLYARLYSFTYTGASQYVDYTYKESGTPVKAALTSPTPGATLGSTATFTWTKGGGVTSYEFRLGTTGPGSKDVYNPTGSVTSALTTGSVAIPSNGVTLYARLYSWINGAWQYTDYTYTEP
jgi:sugar lactone lactonase YvrE